MSKFYIPSCWVTFLPRRQEIVLKTLLVFSLCVFFFHPCLCAKASKNDHRKPGKKFRKNSNSPIQANLPLHTNLTKIHVRIFACFSLESLIHRKLEPNYHSKILRRKLTQRWILPPKSSFYPPRRQCSNLLWEQNLFYIFYLHLKSVVHFSTVIRRQFTLRKMLL